MLLIKIFENGEEKDIVINQKHICSFKQIFITELKMEATEVRMSNGDIHNVIKPPYDQWQPDAWITDTDY